MHTEMIKIPKGQRLIRSDETIEGETVALARIAIDLFGVYTITPLGHVNEAFYEGSRLTADSRFERILMGSC